MSEKKHEPLYPSVWVDLTTYAIYSRIPWEARVNEFLAKFTTWRIGTLNGRRTMFRIAP